MALRATVWLGAATTGAWFTGSDRSNWIQSVHAAPSKARTATWSDALPVKKVAEASCAALTSMNAKSGCATPPTVKCPLPPPVLSQSW